MFNTIEQTVFIEQKYKNNTNIFNHFRKGLKVPAGRSGKLTHIYIDQERSGTVKDYTGSEYNYVEKTGIHLEPAAYHLTFSPGFDKYLLQKHGGI